jgi:hypothetical protein
MYSLIYSSEAVEAFKPDDLEEMLIHFRSTNKDLGITGALLYDGEHKIMQALEGPELNVKILYNQIVKDARHHSIRVLSKCKITQRNFDAWSMHYKEYSAETLEQKSKSFGFAGLFGDMPLIDFDPTIRLAQTFRKFFD